MRTCNNCGTSIEHKRKNALYCDSKCKAKAGCNRYYQKNKAKIAEIRKDYYSDNREEILKYKAAHYSLNTEQYRTYYRENKETICLKLSEKRKIWWTVVGKEQADKCVDLFERMNENQRHRYADWLLIKQPTYSRHHKVDEWIADYNTTGA